jgi:chromosome segregation ATPase
MSSLPTDTRRAAMTRQRRDLTAEQAALTAAANRLLGATPLRATSGDLTASELIIESGLRRDVVYRDHKHLVEDYHARVRAQTFIPDRIHEITAERDQLKARLAETAEQLRQERRTTSTLRRLVTELSLELQQAHEQHATNEAVTRLPRSSRTSNPPRPGRLHPAG